MSQGAPTMVSVVLCVKNGAATIAEQVRSLAGQTYDGAWELLIVDNGSTDDSVDLAVTESSMLQVRVIPALEKSGPAYAKNLGVHAAYGDLIAFCDADDRADPDWLTELVAVAKTADMVGGFADISEINDEVVRHWRPEYPRDRLPFPGPAVHGANVAIWKDVFIAAGGCDEQLATAAGDDIDLSWRVRRAGYRLKFAPLAVMHYRLRPTLTGQAKQMFAYGRAETFLARRHGDHARSTRKLAFDHVRLMCVFPRYVYSPVGRGQWIRSFAMSAGRIAEQISRSAWWPARPRHGRG